MITLVDYIQSTDEFPVLRELTYEDVMDHAVSLDQMRDEEIAVQEFATSLQERQMLALRLRF